jgi:hypothetical protein
MCELLRHRERASEKDFANDEHRSDPEISAADEAMSLKLYTRFLYVVGENLLKWDKVIWRKCEEITISCT